MSNSTNPNKQSSWGRGVRRCFTYIFFIYQALPLDEPGFLGILICWSIWGNETTLNKQLLHCDVLLDDPDVAAPKKSEHHRSALLRDAATDEI